MKKDLDTLKGLDTKTLVAMMYIEFGDMKTELRADYVRKDQFLPVRRCCYFITSTLGIGLIGFIIKHLTG